MKRAALEKTKKKTDKNILVSVITPTYNEAANLPLLYERLKKSMKPLQVKWEWIIVDDHSTDKTFDVVSKIAKLDRRVQAVRFVRNYGSHTAIVCGSRLAKGTCAVILAGDLQDPPELVQDMFLKWEKGVKVVWAMRERREGEGLLTRFFARSYYFTMRHFIGLSLPPHGADFFLMDRIVIEALARFQERNVNIFLLIGWMGFSQDSITYRKQKRVYGKSGWTLQKKIKLFIDSVTAFSFSPIRMILGVGTAVAILGLVFLLFNYESGNEGRLMSLIVVLLGIQMLMTGILGEYLWRAFDETRRRPTYLIEAATNPKISALLIKKRSDNVLT